MLFHQPRKNALKRKTTPQTIYILVGPPGCGKSTYVNALTKKLAQQNYTAFIISSDNIVEQLCLEHKIRYRQYFELATFHPIRQQHKQRFDNAIRLSKKHVRVIWDLTNLQTWQRDNIKQHYDNARFIAVEFQRSFDTAYLKAVNQSRQTVSEKFIPDNVLTKMLNDYQQVTLQEGFDDLVLVSAQCL